MKIRVLSDSGLLLITGTPEDVRWLTQRAEEFRQLASRQRTQSKVVPLDWVSPIETAESLQFIYDEQYAPTLGVATINPVSIPRRGVLVTGSESAIAIVRDLAAKMEGK